MTDQPQTPLSSPTLFIESIQVPIFIIIISDLYKRVSAQHQVDYSHRNSVCLSVCLNVTLLSCAQTVRDSALV